jgi:hypothetical protein
MNRVTEPIFPPGRYPAIYIGKEGCVKKPKPNTITCIAQKEGVIPRICRRDTKKYEYKF